MQSYKLNLTKVPLILAIFAWAKDKVPIPSMGFGIGDKLADAMLVSLIRSGQMHTLSIHLCTKNIGIVITKN